MVRWVMIAVLGLVAVAAGVEGVRSYWWGDQVVRVDGRKDGTTILAAYSGHGQVLLECVNRPRLRMGTFPAVRNWSGFSGGPVGESRGWWGFDWESRVDGDVIGAYSERVIGIPWWLVVVMFGGAAVWVWWRGRRRRGAGTWGTGGVCAKCGYDLRATPERCPECGQQPRSGVETPTQG